MTNKNRENLARILEAIRDAREDTGADAALERYHLADAGLES